MLNFKGLMEETINTQIRLEVDETNYIKTALKSKLDHVQSIINSLEAQLKPLHLERNLCEKTLAKLANL